MSKEISGVPDPAKRETLKKLLGLGVSFVAGTLTDGALRPRGKEGEAAAPEIEKEKLPVLTAEDIKGERKKVEGKATAVVTKYTPEGGVQEEECSSDWVSVTKIETSKGLVYQLEIEPEVVSAIGAQGLNLNAYTSRNRWASTPYNAEEMVDILNVQLDKGKDKLVFFAHRGAIEGEHANSLDADWEYHQSNEKLRQFTFWLSSDSPKVMKGEGGRYQVGEDRSSLSIKYDIEGYGQGGL